MLLGIGVVVTAYTLANILCLVLQCVPLKRIWDPTVPARCFNLLPVFLACAGLNIATDLAMFGLPIPTLWALHLSTWKRVQLIMIFLLGGW